MGIMLASSSWHGRKGVDTAIRSSVPSSSAIGEKGAERREKDLT
jgi:hypothetical protein